MQCIFIFWRMSVFNLSSGWNIFLTAYGTLKRLKLRDNPFVCNCDLTWFRQWIDRSKGYNISTDKVEWLCSDSKITVLEYHPETSAYINGDYKHLPCLE
jgi:hypothetical protein